MKHVWRQLRQSTKQQRKDYIQGTVRQFMYDRTYLRILLTKYLRSTYETRKDQARDCYLNGECLHCGCTTPDKFMADSACSDIDSPCYPEMKPFFKRLFKLNK